MSTEGQKDALRRGIAIATAAYANSPEGLLEVTWGYIQDDPRHEVTAQIGLTNLVTILLTRLEKVSGVPALETLQEISRRYIEND